MDDRGSNARAGSQRSVAPQGMGRVHAVTVWIVIGGLMVTVALAVISKINYDRTEQRLLTLDTKLTGSALTSGVSTVQGRLQTAAEEALATGGNPTSFKRFVAPFVTKGTGWNTVSLWRFASPPVLVAEEGSRPLIADSPIRAAAVFEEATRAGSFVVTNLISAHQLRLGYAIAQQGPRGTFVVYAESVLPANHRLAIQTSSPLSDLNYALYLGTRQTDAALLAATPVQLPLSGPTSTVRIPFGSNFAMTLVMSPRVSLAGAVAGWLPWLVAAIGILFTALVAVMSEHLVRRRRRAEDLAVQNRLLFQAQRSTAETLQRSLLPQSVPEPENLDLAVRYVPGIEGMEIGGDWYNVTDVGEGRFFFAVGDVSGRGVTAASLMAELRFAIKAYAKENPEPGDVMNRISRLSRIGDTGHFATVLCGLLDNASRTLTLASAGHPNPVLAHGGRAELLATETGPPIGVQHDRYPAVRTPVPHGATLIAYTDGLVERRGESIDEGLERLRQVSATGGPLEPLLDRLLSTLVPQGSSDDIVLVGVHWN
jgi:serine phosphatase RsbU (regulator of sigma subunit)